jgi:hypothetical protein
VRSFEASFSNAPHFSRFNISFPELNVPATGARPLSPSDLTISETMLAASKAACALDAPATKKAQTPVRAEPTTDSTPTVTSRRRRGWLPALCTALAMTSVGFAAYASTPENLPTTKAYANAAAVTAVRGWRAAVTCIGDIVA